MDAPGHGTGIFTAPFGASLVGFWWNGRQYDFQEPVRLRAGDIFEATPEGFAVNGTPVCMRPRKRPPFLFQPGPKDWMPRPPAHRPH